jgi:hypothetical protein
VDGAEDLAQEAQGFVEALYYGAENRCELDELMNSRPHFNMSSEDESIDDENDEEKENEDLRRERPVRDKDENPRTTHYLKALAYNLWGISAL